MRMTVYNADINNFILRVDLTSAVLSMSSTYQLNPLDVIKDTPGMLSIFHTVGCIGDSLASGESAYKDGGTTKYVDLYPFSWGQCLARMTGNLFYNFSKGGLSAKTWLTSEYAVTAFDGNHKCDAYIIGLGQNDKNQGYTVGTTADINLADYTQNADTFCGNYGKIIQMIKEHQPKAKIFVITDPLESVNTYGINTAIRNVAALFTNVYVLDFYQYGADFLIHGFLHNQYRSGHFNALGYQYIAKMIATYIDWYIMNNYSEFSQVEFIGTDYSW
jgi:lysophospholipase L1-like esterase